MLGPGGLGSLRLPPLARASGALVWPCPTMQPPRPAPSASEETWLLWEAPTRSCGATGERQEGSLGCTCSWRRKGAQCNLAFATDVLSGLGGDALRDKAATCPAWCGPCRPHAVPNSPTNHHGLLQGEGDSMMPAPSPFGKGQGAAPTIPTLEVSPSRHWYPQGPSQPRVRESPLQAAPPFSGAP